MTSTCKCAAAVAALTARVEALEQRFHEQDGEATEAAERARLKALRESVKACRGRHWLGLDEDAV